MTRATALDLLFAIALVLSAALLFASEPMIARMLLPAAGGAAAVWTTSLVFFQTALLGGYLYAHLSARRLSIPAQVTLHLALLAAAFAVLPLSPDASGAPPASANPIPWLLKTLSMTIGLPFLALSATTPLVQSWFARVQPDGNAYRLYSASNAGSIAGLLAYPALIEPALALRTQSVVWTAGYAGVALLIAACGAIAVQSRSTRMPLQDPVDTETPSARTRLAWIALAALPASLTLSVTTYISTDLAAIPLVWILPLSLYLASFVVAFARPGQGRWASLVTPVVILPPVVSILTEATRPVWLQMPAHLAAFFVVSLACHQALARSRPGHGRLPEFYLWLAFGGAIGAFVTALGAPLAFATPLEYPIGLLLACYAGSSRGRRVAFGWLDVAGPVTAALLVAGLAELAVRLDWAASALLTHALTFGPSLLIAALLWPWPRRFVATLGAVFAAGALWTGAAGQTIHVVRSFYGVHRVQYDDGRQFHLLVDGSTIHGIQRVGGGRGRDCIGYYSRIGPAGEVFAMLEGTARPRRVAVLGLGAGSLACYASPDQQWTFFEIDPAVVALARAPEYFTYLADTPAPTDIVVGDARLTLGRPDRQPYDLIVIDVFSSDAIPIHLLTREAFRTYVRQLSPGGRILFHVSNLYLNLRPVAGAAAAAEGLTAIARRHEADQAEANDGIFPSEWVLVARSARDFGLLASDQTWEAVLETSAAWTDDHSSLLRALKLRR